MSINKNKLISREDINGDLVLINGSSTDYICTDGFVYKDCDGLFYKKKNTINQHNGYAYTGVTMKDGTNKSYRVHRLIAIAFIPNPNNYKIVGHKNNIKYDNRILNLYWTTTSENTKKAYDDGLAKNDKGEYDSQSISIFVFKDNVFHSEYGSISECSKAMNIPKSTIIRRAKGEIKTSYRKYKEFDFKFKSFVTTIENIV